MEVVLPVHDFQFDSTTSTPYVSAPSSPKRIGDPFNYRYHYTSAPNSPTHVAAVYRHFTPPNNSTSPANPFGWDDTPATEVEDFEFDFSGHLEKGKLPPELTTADELFEKGRIRPLKPPPRMQQPDKEGSLSSSPRSPRSRTPRSPRRKGVTGPEELDPFTAAMVEVTRDRGRDTNPLRDTSSRSRKGSRSLSPLRIQGVLALPSSPTPSTSSSSTQKSSWSKKWRLRDLLLFRSASEGRATGNRSKDPLRKYTLLPSSQSSASILPPTSPNKRSILNDSKNASFRSTDSNGSMRRGSGAAISAHELHYTSNRAAAEESKKKTPLPYRQGFFGCLNFNPAINSIVRGFSSSSLNQSSP